VGVQELKQRALADQAALAQPVHDPIVTIGGAALVHQLRLALRVEVLGDLAHDAEHLPLPRPETRRRLLQEIEEVLLRQFEQRAAPPLVERFG
jgi:hypothetical protein